MSLRIDILQERDQLDRIAGDWMRLSELGECPFTSPAWFFSTLRTTRANHVPAVFAAFDDSGRLVGALPFLRTRGRSGLELAGAGAADILQPAARPEDAAAVARAAGEALMAHRVRGPVRLGRVEESATWWRELAAGASLAPAIGPLDRLPFATLPESWDAYLAGRSRSFRSQVGRKMRALEREHDVAIARLEAGPKFMAGLNALFNLHDRRSRDVQRDSAFGEGTRDFQRLLAGATSAAGWARLFVMSIDQEPVAAWYGWRLGRRTFYYQAGFDPTWHRHSVGLLLLAETVKEAIREGSAEYDMLLGDEEFKSRFADHVRTAHQVTLTRRFGPTRLRESLHAQIRRSARHIPESKRARVRAALLKLRLRR